MTTAYTPPSPTSLGFRVVSAPTYATREEVAALTIETFKELGHEALLPYLTIDWSGRFTTRLGDAVYTWLVVGWPQASYPQGNTRSPVTLLTQYKGAVQDVERADGRSAFAVVRVRFSIPLWKRATPQERYETVVHEVAHVVTYREAHLDFTRVTDPHGREWQAVMHRAGIEPRRTHTVDTSGLGHRKVQAACACDTHDITTRKAALIVQGKAKYLCAKCRTIIKVQGGFDMLAALASKPVSRVRRRRSR